jgi:hypothetical protein
MFTIVRPANHLAIFEKSKQQMSSEQEFSGRYHFRKCPICTERLLVRINGCFVHKWINAHFATHHFEHLHVVVNMHSSTDS